ncbi:MAG: hypothetical protein RL026_2307 [Pseudomonadota bacterium]|jgi:Zn-finger nucleic acid-binding protein
MNQPANAMACPNCRVALVMSERQGVEIDYCPQCRGVWLDRGELDKIIERASRELSGPAEARPAPQAPASVPPPAYGSAPPYGAPPAYGNPDYRGHHGHPQQHYYGKRKKSFLEDLFD